MSKFDDIILKNLITQTGTPIMEQTPAGVDPMAAPAADPMAAPAADPMAAPPAATPVPETPDEPALKINLLDLARKALLVNPNSIDQSSKGVLTNTVTQENAAQIEEVLNSIVSIESDVDTGGVDLSYNKTN